MPAPRFHTVKYAGVLAAARPWRPRIVAKPPTEEPSAARAESARTGPAGGYRPWAELLARTFGYLAVVGEATEVPRRCAGRGPPYWKSRILRRQALGDEEECGSQSDGAGGAAQRWGRWHQGPGAHARQGAG